MTMRGAARWSFMVLGAIVVVLGFWTVHCFRLGLNGSGSLPENAFLLWTWPKVIRPGVVIAADPPEAVRDRFEGVYFMKRVVGVAGDVIRHDADGAVCVRARCFPPLMVEGRPFAPALPEGVIPEGAVAAFGDSPDSLDSRYAIIGLFPVAQVQAVGFGASFVPHWTVIAKWLNE
ncbi:S26 family signal peptidase [Methylobacterium sp.]|uniref:S26 family signal peptidase n=1 Tax=Methylobacterium sp. TaxID=409 RepID=UPI003C757AA7